jgi:hypothetical protein
MMARLVGIELSLSYIAIVGEVPPKHSGTVRFLAMFVIAGFSLPRAANCT